MKKLYLFLLVFCLAVFPSAIPADGSVADDPAPFDPEQWDLSRAKIVDHLERKALMGTAFLKSVDFRDGVIEVEIATTDRTRSYPGVLFRVADPANYERFYIRPHRSPFYDDALQYGPTFNGVDSWQLYHGPGRSSDLEIPPGRWNRLRIVVSGSQAQVFWNDSPGPVLTCDNLARGLSSGTIGLVGPMDGSAFFSNLTFKSGGDSPLPPAEARVSMPGLITGWRISEPFALAEADFTRYPDALAAKAVWKDAPTVDERGLVDVSRFYSRRFQGGDAVLAKTILAADGDKLLRVGFGYSDYISVYLNGQPVYFGVSAYQSRDRSFLGIVGFNDNLFLPLKKGDNELVVMVGECSGGWGFCVRDEDAVMAHPSLKKEWTKKSGTALPESAVYDPANDVVYVSNYFNEGNEFLSKVSTSGEILVREWIKGLRLPTGLALRGNTLYAVDRSGLKVIDVGKGEITSTIPLTGMRAPNDVTLAENGDLYISDLPAGAVFRYSGGTLERWIENLSGPNGLLAEPGRLIVGQNEALLAVNLADKSVNVLARFEQGANIDGLQADGRGGYFVSDYDGKLYRISKDGTKTLLLNTSTPGDQIADFAYIPGRKLLFIPMFQANGLAAYRVFD